MYMLDKGRNAPERIARCHQSSEHDRVHSERQVAEMRSTLESVHPQVESPLSVVSSLQRWCTTLSWSKCDLCNSVMAEKLLPGYRKLEKYASQVKCPCIDGKYIVPAYDDIPPELRVLSGIHVQALWPCHIDCGRYERMKYGYRKKTAIFRVTWSKQSVEEKIALLESESDRSVYICPALSAVQHSLIILTVL